MNRTTPLRWTTALAMAVLAASTTLHAGPKERPSFAQIFRNAEPQLTRPLPTITGWADGRHYLETRRSPGVPHATTMIVDAVTGTAVPQADMARFAGLTGEGIAPGSSVSSEGSRFLYLSAGDLYCLDTTARTFRRLTDTPGEEQNPILSPDGNHVAFTRANDLYSVEITTGRETRYTADGSDVVYSGRAAWLYYEEILGRGGRYRAFWWSPDSRSIAFYRFDETRVPEFPLFRADGVHGSLERTRYPKPGDPNPEVRIGIVRTGQAGITWAAFDPALDQYFGPVFWTPDSRRVLIQWMNRDQDSLIVHAVDPKSGTPSPLFLEHQTGWVDWFESIDFLADNGGFIVLSDRDGWPHLYLYGMDGTLRNRITGGEWPVTGIKDVNNASRTILFTARKEAPTRTDLYAVRFDGTKMRRLTSGEATHAVNVAPGGAFFITTSSTASTPSRMAVIDAGGSVVRTLGDAATDDFSRYELAQTRMLTIPTSDGLNLPARMTLPFDFDPARQYPVLMSVYGGPNSASVFDGWRGISDQWLALEGVIQIAVDHRGSGHFGKKGSVLMHRKLGTWEMRDYGDAVRWLKARGYVDSTRIAITGGSYGGYVTALALTAGADLFTHGIAEYSVVDWLLYDSHYTERYMDTPAANPEGYREGSVLTHAWKYRGKLRIVHGTMDDNVHMQNSIQLVDTLQDMNKEFELMLYPGGRHGWGGPKAVHLRTDNHRFLYRHLIRKEFPEELFKTLDASSLKRRPG